ncbi:MAG TPA: RecQ family ATP-dependent DNA helicase [Candidatus Omnitrophota bacterium]|nr:RecQ family ATP-dependent DNA helicase [Candidatus Omnitrophota bacterium]
MHRMKVDTTSGCGDNSVFTDASAVADPVAEMATSAFGIKYLFPWQRLVIANILDAVQASNDARDTPDARNAVAGDTPDILAGDELHDEDGALRGQQIVLLPTGAGKSLCFQIPALFLDKPTLVIYPLLALMSDQMRRMNESALEAVIFRGGQSPEERKAQFARLDGSDGKPPARLVIANPEVLVASEAVIGRLEKRGISHFAIDEAHCVAEWGDSFRPSYLELGGVIERLRPSAVTAFTATASPPVLARIADALFGGQAHVVRGDTDRPNIKYRVVACRAKAPALVREVASRERPMVIFCATRGGTEKTARMLREILHDEDILFYHAGLRKEEKQAVEAWFHGHARAILCCTCAWGMGVDKKDIRTVIHKDAPPTVEAYVQEAGRGGRDGLDAEAVLLWSMDDATKIAKKADRSSIFLKYAECSGCRRDVILRALGDPGAGADAPEGKTVACSGCDVCDGTAIRHERDAEIVVEAVRKNSHAYTKAELAEYLYERGNALSRERHGFAQWRLADFSLMIDSLLKDGSLRELDRWPFRGKLALTPVRG